MRSLSKNVKKDPQEYVYQGSLSLYYLQNSKNIERTLFCWAKIKRELHRKTSKQTLKNTFIRSQKKMKIRDRRKLICEVCRKTSKQTLRKTFIRG